jgi:hypothetical protein
MITTHHDDATTLRVEIAELIGGTVEVCGTLYLHIERGFVDYPESIRVWFGTLRVSIDTHGWPTGATVAHAREQLPGLVAAELQKMTVRDRDIAAEIASR